jgi:hypothetical protein
MLLIGWSHVGFADLDYSVGLDSGTMPYWSNFNASFGYGVLIWGEDPLKSIPNHGFVNPSEYPYKFGYVRPEISVETSGTRNAINGDLDISPISWVIFSLGKTLEHRASNGRLDYDCALNSCYGSLQRSRLTFGGFPLGFGPFFVGGLSQTEWFDSYDEGKSGFVDQWSGLVGKKQSDRLKRDALLGGIILSQDVVLGGGISIEKFIGSKESSQVNFGSLTLARPPFEMNLIVGERDRSPKKHDEFWGLLNVRWIGKKALGQ